MKRLEKLIRRGKSKFYKEFMKSLIINILLVLFCTIMFIGIVRALFI